MAAAEVSPVARAVARRLAPMRLDLHAGSDAPGLLGLVALARLAELEPDAIDLVSSHGPGASRVTLHRDVRAVDLDAATLGSPLDALLEQAALELAPPAELYATLVRSAVALDRQQALDAALEQVAAAPTLEQAASALVATLLLPALGFGRVALFVPHPGRTSFSPLAVIVRGDTQAIPLGAAPLSQRGPVSSRHIPRSLPFAEMARTVVLQPGPHPDDEVALALRGEGPLFEPLRGPRSDGLATLHPQTPFFLGRLAVRDPHHPLGLLFADGIDPALSRDRDHDQALGSLLARASLVWEHARLRRDVEELARTDAMTGLLNRRELEGRFGQERSRAQRSKAPLSFLLVAPDPTVPENPDAPPPSRGPEALRAKLDRDGVLRAVAAILRAELRAHDVAARFDGEDLAVVLPGAGSFEAALVARRIGVAAHKKGLSICIGASSYPDDSDHPDDLVSLAADNLVAARSIGPGRAALSGDGGGELVFADEVDT